MTTVIVINWSTASTECSSNPSRMPPEALILHSFPRLFDDRIAGVINEQMVGINVITEVALAQGSVSDAILVQTLPPTNGPTHSNMA